MCRCYIISEAHIGTPPPTGCGNPPLSKRLTEQHTSRIGNCQAHGSLRNQIFNHAHALLSTQNTELLAQQTQKQGPCTEQDCHATLAQKNTELLHSFHGIIQLSPDIAAGGPAAAWYTLP